MELSADSLSIGRGSVNLYSPTSLTTVFIPHCHQNLEAWVTIDVARLRRTIKLKESE